MTTKLPTSTQPYWIESASLPRFTKLDRDEHVDVVVVGGGITGLTAAYLLTLEGRRVALLERGRCAEADTALTTAHLTMVTDQRMSALVKRFGRDHAQATWDAGLAAIAQIGSIVSELDLSCDFAWVPGYLHAPMGQPADVATMDALRAEAMLAADMGFDASFTDDLPFAGRVAVRFDGQARFHPRKYLAGLARAITDRGGMIFEHSDAEKFSDRPRSVTANGHTLTCDEIVLATHTPLTGNTLERSAALFQTKLALYSSYAITARVDKGRVPDALFWDTDEPYHYMRIEPHRDHDLVIFGGEDHKTGQADDTRVCLQRLEQTLTSIVGDADITCRWSGQVIETPDGLPFIGDTAPHQFAGTGYSGNGMTFGTLAGMMAADRIMGRSNPWRDLFSPARTTLSGLWDYIKENKDYPYYRIRDRFAGAEGKSVRAVPRNSGRVLDVNGEAIAVYRDQHGAVTKKSANCSHMGCLVDWNEAERTWDCPCHGSRFKPNGKVMAGPAESPLDDPKD